MSASSLTSFSQAPFAQVSSITSTAVPASNKMPGRSGLANPLRRTINHITWSLKGICARTADAAQKTLKIADKIVSDPNALASICRRLNFQVMEALDQLKKLPGYFSKFRMACGSYVGLVDAIQIIDDLECICTKQYKNDNGLKLASRLAVGVANVTETLSWLQDLGFIQLGRAAAALGEVRLFSFVPKVISSIPLTRNMPKVMRAATCIGNTKVFPCFSRLSLGAIGGRAILLYYTLSIADNLKAMSKAETSFDKKQAGLNVTYYLSELTLNALLIFGLASVASIGILGATSLVTGIAGFAHKNSKSL